MRWCERTSHQGAGRTPFHGEGTQGMSQPVTVWMFGHTETTDNVARVISGHRDCELTEEGRNRATAIGERYRDEDFDVVFCSDTKRARESAQLMFGSRGIPIVEDALLREANYGDLAGKPREEVFPDLASRLRFADVPFPNGESFSDVAARTDKFLDELIRTRRGQQVAIVAHLSTISFTARRSEGLSVADSINWMTGRPPFVFHLA